MVLSTTSFTVAGETMASQNWVNSQGFLRTSILSTIALTPTTTNTATSVSFFANTDNSGSNFTIGWAISGLTSNEFGIGHPTAGYASWGFKMDTFGKCSFARDVSTLGMLTVNSGLHAAPQYVTRSSGTRIVLWDAVNNSSVDYAIGIEGSTLWNSILQLQRDSDGTPEQQLSCLFLAADL